MPAAMEFAITTAAMDDSMMGAIRTVVITRLMHWTPMLAWLYINPWRTDM